MWLILPEASVTLCRLERMQNRKWKSAVNGSRAAQLSPPLAVNPGGTAFSYGCSAEASSPSSPSGVGSGRSPNSRPL